VENVTEETSNPFGMRPPCPHPCEGTDRRAVFGFGDANAEFHVIGDHPGVHGGAVSGIPFTGTPAGERVLDVLEVTGFLLTREPDIAVANVFLSYRYLCCVPPGGSPGPEAYDRFEPFFDAELRAIAADVLVPVGAGTTAHVLEEYAAGSGGDALDMADLHGRQVRGRGFLILPLADPSTWDETAHDRAVAALEDVLSIDYHQLVDLGRFLPGGDPYFVR
jgi:uracil-DNA glycosylase family 4